MKMNMKNLKKCFKSLKNHDVLIALGNCNKKVMYVIKTKKTLGENVMLSFSGVWILSESKPVDKFVQE